MRWVIVFLTTCSSLLAQLAQVAGGAGAVTAIPIIYPVITYTCTHNVINAITVNPDQPDNFKVKTAAGYCKRTKDGKQGLLQCIHDNMGNSKVHLVYSTDPASDVVAGKDFKYYELLCTEKTEIKNASVTVSSFSPTASTPLWNTLKANPNSGDPTLTVSPNKDLKVGQELTLTMKLAGTEYLLSPQECNAHRSTGVETNYPIWECRKPPKDANIIKQGLWVSNSSGGQQETSVSIKMFAFKFIDSTDVVIECSAIVCPTGNQDTCALNLCNPSRKRRSQKTTNTQMNVPIRHASVSLKVREPLLNSNSVSGLTTRWYAYLVPACLIIGARLYV